MSKRERTQGEERFPQRRRTPSFSSTLLDSIYRSLDELDDQRLYEHHSHHQDREITKKRSNSVSLNAEVRERMDLYKDVMVKNWIGKQSIHCSASSSSESSSGAGFSSSEAESTHSKQKKTKPKLVRTGVVPAQPEERQPKSKHEGGGFTKTKLKALKIYGELKKVKQPISPGGKIANFLNSIFNSNVKKAKMCHVGAVEDVNMVNINKPSKSCASSSSASSFSRSCLSKPASARGKLSSANKRSVRFYPISVIVGEDCQPCGHKIIYQENPIKFVKPSAVNQVQLKNYVMKRERHYFKGFLGNADGNYSDDDDDKASYSSSDLFELDHQVGIGRYQEELPVYGTTSIRTNQAIANGFMM